MPQKKSPLEKPLIYSLSIAFMILLWKVASMFVDSMLILPSPEAVVQSLVGLLLDLRFWISAASSFVRVVLAFFISGFAGVLIGAVCARFEKLRLFLAPPLSVVGATPVVSVILVCIFWLGPDRVPVLSAVLMALPVMVNSSCKGFSACTKADYDFAKCFGLRGSQFFFFIKFPKAVPFIEGGIKTSSSMVWKVCAAAEVLSVPKNALGAMMQRSQATLETQELLALTVLIVAFSCLWNVALKGLFLLLGKGGSMACRLYFKNKSIYSSSGESFGKGDGEKVSVGVEDFSSTRELSYSHLNLVFESQRTAVLGESGCGKTTLLDFIGGVLPQEEVVSGRRICIPKTVAYCFQTPYAVEGLTVRQNLLLPLTRYMAMEEALGRVDEVIEEFELTEKADSCAESLSGGQKERLSLARAMVFPSRLILLDEPFVSQDEDRRKRICEAFLQELKNQGRKCIMVTHSRELAQKLGFSVIEL